MEFRHISRGLVAAFLLVSTNHNGAADPAPARLSQVAITPVSEGTPSSFSGMVTGAPPNGTARLQASVDMGVADTWTDIATTALDNLGSATFTNISDSRPQAAAAKWNFFRVSTTSAPPPPGNMVFIPGGTFQMGDAFGEGNSDERELPVHSVYVSGFHLQNTEVTKAQWDAVRAWGLNNGYTDLPVGGGKATNHPVHSINWYAMVKWCNARSQMENLTLCYTTGGAAYKTGTNASVACNWNASGYRLPTEAEWEKAARGGLSGKRFPWGDTINHVHANYRANGSAFTYDTSSYTTGTYHPTYNDGVSPYTSPVGSFPANGYGLYDMAGNMWECCWDWYSSSYYSTSPGTDPRGPSSGSNRVFRGGDYYHSASHGRTANRINFYPNFSGDNIGFRPARSSFP